MEIDPKESFVKTNWKMMLKRLFAIVMVFTFAVGASALIVSTSQTWSGDYTLTEDLTIKSGVTLTITGSLYDTNKYKLIVEAGAMLIVEGNLDLENTNSALAGNIIVRGNVTLKNTDMIGSSNLVIGGTLASGGGNLNGVTGDVYLLDPDANPNPPTLPNPPKDADQLITDESGSLVDIVGETIGDVLIHVWIGNSDDWSIETNWTKGTVPTQVNSVLVNASPTGSSFPLSCGSKVYVMWNLTLEPGAQLIIPTGSMVTVYGDVTIPSSASLTVQNSNAQPTSFIVHGNVAGNINFKWTYNNGNWWFIGHPISNPVMTAYESLRPLNDYAMYDLLNDGSLYKVSDNAGTYNLSGQEKLKGYLFKVKEQATVSHSGLMNNDAVYSKTLQSGWQIIANPYPSYYQFPLEDAADANADFYHTTGTVYVTTSTSNSDKVFSTFNILTGISSPANSLANGIIAPGQAFYVKTATAGDVKMRAANRIHAVGTPLKSAVKVTESNVLRLKLSNESGGVDEAVFAFRENGSVAYDRMDSEQRFNTNNLSYIYSIVDGNKAVINVLPQLENSWQQSLGIEAKAGTHKVYIEGLETLTPDVEVILEDKLTGVFTQLGAQAFYEFTAGDGSCDERFVLHFNKTQVATDIDEQEEVVNSEADVYIQDKCLKATCNWDSNSKLISLYSLSGALVWQHDMPGNNYDRVLNLPSGIYVVKITDNNHVFEKKLMIR